MGPAPLTSYQSLNVLPWVGSENLYDPAKVGEIDRDSATGRRRYQIHRTPGTNNEESPWLQNSDELETWLISRGACKDKKWNLVARLPASATLIPVEQSRFGGKRIYRYSDGIQTRTSDWLQDGAHLEWWLKSIGAYAHLPTPDDVKRTFPTPESIAEMQAVTKELEPGWPTQKALNEPTPQLFNGAEMEPGWPTQEEFDDTEDGEDLDSVALARQRAVARMPWPTQEERLFGGQENNRAIEEQKASRIAEMELDLRKLEACAAMCRTFETEKSPFPPMFAGDAAPDTPAAEAVVVAPKELTGEEWHVQFGKAWSEDPEPAAEAVLDADTGDCVGTETAQKLILHDYNSTLIAQRPQDGYVNATAMCQAHGKLFNNYGQTQSAKDFVASLEVDTGIPVSDLVVVRKGGAPSNQGTWVHPQVALHLAFWCSSAFAVWATKHLLDWMKGTTTPALDFSDPLTAAKLYIEAEEGKRRALQSLSVNRQLLGAAAEQLVQTKQDLNVKEGQLEVAVTEKKEVQQYNAELLFELDKANEAVSMWDFFPLTINVLGMTRPIGFKLCRHYGILNKATENQWGLEETLPCAEWAGMGYFTMRYPKVVLPIKDQNGKKTGEAHKVPRKTTYTTPDRKDAAGAVEKGGGFNWLLNKLYHDERCLLYRLVQQHGGKGGLLRPLYGCVVEWCNDSEIPPHPRLRHDIIRLYRPTKSKGETMWRAARQIESKQYLAEGITQEEALKRLSSMMPKDAPRPLTAEEDA